MRPAEWSAPAAAMLARAMLADPGASVDTLRALVESGEGKLFEVAHEGRAVGFVVLRIDRRDLLTEGVIVAAAGSLPGADLVASVLPVLEGAFVGVSRVRIHTARRGMVRKLARHGYATQEVVLSKSITRRQPCQQPQGGGGSSSSSSTQNVDKRLVVETGIGISSDMSTVNVQALDGGAVARSLDLGRDAVAGVLGLAGNVLSTSLAGMSSNAQLLDRASGFIDKAYADAKGSGAERYFIAAAVLGVVAVVAIQSKAFR